MLECVFLKADIKILNITVVFIGITELWLFFIFSL